MSQKCGPKRFLLQTAAAAISASGGRPAGHFTDSRSKIQLRWALVTVDAIVQSALEISQPVLEVA